MTDIAALADWQAREWFAFAHLVWLAAYLGIPVFIAVRDHLRSSQ